MIEHLSGFKPLHSRIERKPSSIQWDAEFSLNTFFFSLSFFLQLAESMSVASMAIEGWLYVASVSRSCQTSLEYLEDLENYRTFSTRRPVPTQTEHDQYKSSTWVDLNRISSHAMHYTQDSGGLFPLVALCSFV